MSSTPLDSGHAPAQAASGHWAADESPTGYTADRDRPLELPDRSVFWSWVWSNVRPVVGWVLAALGALALFLGWFGVSGQALTAKQLPYLVSGGLGGIALIILAGVFLATEDWRRQVARLAVLERKVDDLLALLTTDAPLDPSASPLTAAPRTGGAELVALPNGSVYHRAGCALVAGKAQAGPVDAATIAGRGLTPCRVCDPPPAAG